MSFRLFGWLAVALAGVLVLAAAGWGLLHPAGVVSGDLAVGRPAPDLVVHAFDGSTVRLSDLRGRPVVLNFWASWCVPCRQEDPVLQTAAREHGGEVAFLGVAVHDSEAAARAYEEALRHPYPVGQAIAGDPARFGVAGPPETVFIDAQGRLAAKFVGPIDRGVLERHLELVGVPAR